MINKIPLNVNVKNVEILARIVKSEAKKYDCSVNFTDDGPVFIGDSSIISYIVKDALSDFPEE
ncbi:MAG: hypothetical protein GY757_52925 [bacterium]|nr:hypothetical protein [bacterium]